MIILDKFDKLNEKRIPSCKSILPQKLPMDELYKIRKNYGIYVGKEMERALSLLFIAFLYYIL
jgi:relaxase